MQGVAYPADTVRRRMQLSGSLGQSVVYTGYWDCVRRMAATEGPSSFYRGIGVSILRTAPAAAIQVSMHASSFPYQGCRNRQS